MSKEARVEKTPEEFGEWLRSMLDPQTLDEWAQFHEGQERVRENTRRLNELLPQGPGSETADLRCVSIHDLPLDIDPSVLEE